MSIRRRFSVLFGGNRAERRAHERSQTNGYHINGYGFPTFDEEVTPPNHPRQQTTERPYPPVPQHRTAERPTHDAPGTSSRPRFTNLPFRTPPQPKVPVRRLTKEDLRQLCEMIKEKHHLDHVIWGLRNCREPDRKLVEVKMRAADGLMTKIQNVVKNNDKEGVFEKESDYQKFKEIRKLINLPGKRVWMTNPPWNE
jgi:hypothetical protein